ncbi:MAG: hypothetical protein K2X86_02205 [Cytophagaceae bacterium]|nr:hypothetical protein [Cytophagaceae bacterium]
MAVNSVKNQKEESKSSIFTAVESRLRIDKLFEEGIPVKYIPRVLFIAAILIFYIGNTHYAERTVRRINKMKVEVENIRADYTTKRAELMFASKASEVAKKVVPIGLEESLTPPMKIIIKEGEY